MSVVKSPNICLSLLRVKLSMSSYLRSCACECCKVKVSLSMWCKLAAMRSLNLNWHCGEIISTI